MITRKEVIDALRNLCRPEEHTEDERAQLHGFLANILKVPELTGDEKQIADEEYARLCRIVSEHL